MGPLLSRSDRGGRRVLLSLLDPHKLRRPGSRKTGMCGGNSNCRDPIWFPVNVLRADRLRTYGRHFGGPFQVEIPMDSGNLCDLEQAADSIDPRWTAVD